MKKHIIHFVTTILLFTTFQTTALATDSGLTNMLESVRTMRSDFTQTVYDNNGKSILHAYGKMAMQRPGKFRWEVIKPIPQLIIANDVKIWVYDPDLQQVTIRILKHAAGETPALLLSHQNTELDAEFAVKSMPAKTPGSTWFALIPKKPGNMFASIQLGFVKGQIAAMQLQDNLGHTTKIQFQHTQTNTPLAPSMFVFKTPANTDVINETNKK